MLCQCFLTLRNFYIKIAAETKIGGVNMYLQNLKNKKSQKLIDLGTFTGAHPLPAIINDALDKYGGRKKTLVIILSLKETKKFRNKLQPLITPNSQSNIHKYLEYFLPEYNGWKFTGSYMATITKSERRKLPKNKQLWPLAITAQKTSNKIKY